MSARCRAPEDSGPRILFVDDESSVLSGLRRALRARSESWDMQFALGGAEAVELLKRSTFDVVVTDMRMPGMDGVEVLEAARDLCPSVGRIILSGQASQDAIVRACGLAHVYLAKPCETADLLGAIARLLSVRGLLDDQGLRSVLAGAQNIPKPPAVCVRLLALAEDPHSSVSDVVAVVREDVGLCAEIIRIVNSGFFGLNTHVDDVERAATLLGLETLQALALAGKIVGSGSPAAGFDSWSAGYAAAVESGRIARLLALSDGLPREVASQLALAAMLHDVGLRLLAAQLPAGVQSLARGSVGDVFARRGQEIELLGCAVENATAYLLGLWGFSPAVIQALVTQPRTAEDRDSSPDGRLVTFARVCAAGGNLDVVVPGGTWLDPASRQRWLAALSDDSTTDTTTHALAVTAA